MRTIWVLAVVSACLPTLACDTVLAADPAGQIAAHLAAGEFGPALNLARQAPPAARDGLLGQIAAAQAAAGNGSAARQTAVSMADDSARSQSLTDLRSSPPAFGGGPQPDFDSLIDLITSTIAPTTWEDVGGPGAVDGFKGGVWVDTKNTLRKIAPGDLALADLRAGAATVGANRQARKGSKLRMISLTRLEKQLQADWAAGRQPDETMRNLAGLSRVKYVLLYPETGDIVLAGPAGDWQTDAEGHTVSVAGGRPIVQLDDLVVLLRNAFSAEPKFGCSINPTREGLAGIKAYLAESSKQPLKPGTRDIWLKNLQSKLGLQDIVVYGVDPRTHAARVVVEADYRMKLVGMGLEEGVAGVPSYLSMVKVGPDGSLPPMDVLRWWFTLNYDGVSTTAGRDAFAFRGPGVKVLSENELLTERGERVHTGKSEEWNSEFAKSFTTHFDALAAKYPVYAELQNVFDLALVAAIVRSEDLPGRLEWRMTHFGEKGGYAPQLSVAPTKVDSVINHRMIGGKQIVAGVSGGVTVDPRDLVKRGAVKVETGGALSADRTTAAPPKNDRWWWD